ncbi:MAG: histidine phosphatase family protein [Cyclobacteriaceae bacterium]|nr:histidine phosphatase family protein [Cyclobacteriaceae bacterium]
MMSKKIYIIRHGQTDYNLNGIVQGSGVDSSLNSRGREQARSFFQHYKEVPFDKIYTSALRRTRESVEDFLIKGIPSESLPGLNEISWGAKEGQRITPEEDAYYHWMLNQWQLGKTDVRIEGGESPEDVSKRQDVAWDHIMSKMESSVLICMHGRAMRILLCKILNYPLRCMDMFEHENLCLYLVEGTNSNFSIRKYNDTAHLKNIPKIDDSQLVSAITP